VNSNERRRYDHGVVHPAAGLLLIVTERLVIVGGVMALLLAWARRR